ncbi:uridine kinase [Rugosimonospora acidiphila]|uniref:Uridine kinase n=1 Tax=Rugosimonospora acidiphila TaxID=556531 RepID=A0ABP9RYD1_9ACTN
MRIRPVTPARLVDELAGRIDSTTTGGWVRVGFDGAPSAAPGAVADAMVDPLRVLGRQAVRVDLGDFMRPASVRLELGRDNPDSYYERWFDLAALSREVLGPLAPGGSGRIVTTFWNPETDRSSRPSYVDVSTGGVLLLSGPLLQGAGLDLDLVVHCAQSPAALARRTGDELRWTLPAFDRYRDEVDPESLAEVVVRMDDPRHPALVEE